MIVWGRHKALGIEGVSIGETFSVGVLGSIVEDGGFRE